MENVRNYAVDEKKVVKKETNTKMVSFYGTMELQAKNAIVVKVTTIFHEGKRDSLCSCKICLRIGILKKRLCIEIREKNRRPLPQADNERRRDGKSSVSLHRMLRIILPKGYSYISSS